VNGAENCTHFQMGMVRTFKCSKVVVISANQTGRQGKQLEIVGCQRRRCIGKRELPIRIVPCPPIVGRPSFT
jgi:hypothetical protein